MRKIRILVRAEAGFGMVELLCAMIVMSVGILALFAMFRGGVVQVTRASKISTAAALADSAMENYRAVKFETIGLASTDFAAADSTYVNSSGGAYKTISSPQNLVNSTAVVAKCPATPCTSSVPTQTLTGADGKGYRVDTYITWAATSNSSGRTGRDLKLVTILVRDTATSRIYAKVSSSFDQSTGL